MLFDFLTKLDWRGVLEMTVSGVILIILGIAFGSVRAWFEKGRTAPETGRGWVYDGITKMRTLDTKGCYLYAQNFVSRYLHEKAPLMLNAEQQMEDLNHLIDMLDEFLGDTPYEMFAGEVKAHTLHFGEHKVRLHGSVFYIQWFGKYYTHSVPDGVDSLEEIPGYTHESEILSKNHAALVEFLDLIEAGYHHLSNKIHSLSIEKAELTKSNKNLSESYKCLVEENTKVDEDIAYVIETLAKLLDVSHGPLCDIVNQTVQHVDFLRMDNKELNAVKKSLQATVIDIRAKVRLARREKQDEHNKLIETKHELEHYKAVNTEIAGHLAIAKEANAELVEANDELKLENAVTLETRRMAANFPALKSSASALAGAAKGILERVEYDIPRGKGLASFWVAMRHYKAAVERHKDIINAIVSPIGAAAFTNIGVKKSASTQLLEIRDNPCGEKELYNSDDIDKKPAE